MTPALLTRKKKKETTADLSGTLAPDKPFLDVIEDACGRGGRFTLAAESDGMTYTILVDRGGPFNASGGGCQGSAALTMAAALRTGTYTVVEGWPVDLPLYQLGLDATLKNLQGTAITEIPDLPRARGVDSIRNAEWQSTATARVELSPAPTAPAETKFVTPAAAEDAPVLPPVFPRRAAAPAPSPAPRPSAAAPTPPPPIPAARKSAPPQVTAPPTRPTGPTRRQASDPASIGIREDTPKPQGSIRDMRFIEDTDLDAAVPDELGASERQGPWKHLLTQGLLWTVRVEEPARYTLHKAWILVGRSLKLEFNGLFHPIGRRVNHHVSQAREDWRKSGEVVAKQKSRKHGPGRVARPR